MVNIEKTSSCIFIIATKNEMRCIFMKKRWKSIVCFVLASSFLVTICPNVARKMAIFPTTVQCETKRKKVNTIQFEKEIYVVKQGEKIALKLHNTKLSPVYKSGNQEVATVDKNTGIVLAKNVGITEIIAKTEDKKVAKCKVKVIFQKANFKNKFVKQKEGKSITVSKTSTINLPENWDYELQYDGDKYTQYTCLSLPDDEYKGCIYIKKNKKLYKNLVVEDQIQQVMKSTIDKLQKSNLKVTKAGIQTKVFKNQTIGIGTFEVKKETNTEYRTIMIQKMDRSFIEYDCIATSEKENIQFLKAMCHIVASATQNKGEK